MAGSTHGLTLLLLLLAAGAARVHCGCTTAIGSNGISCSSNRNLCIPYSFICDGDRDCNYVEGEDEDGELCAAWRNTDCYRGSVRCRRGIVETCMDIPTYCAADSGCQGDLDPRICQMIEDGAVKPLSAVTLRTAGRRGNALERSDHLGREFVLRMNHTIQHPQCPSMFTLVGDQCVSLFSVGSVSWGEARAFCQVLGGDLITFTDVSDYTSVVRHFMEAQVTVDFWVGGSMADETDGWRWIDEAPVEVGTPLWAVRYEDECRQRNVTFPELNQTREANGGTCYHYVQAPGVPPHGRCLALSYRHYYYMVDEECLQKKSPLCVLSD